MTRADEALAARYLCGELSDDERARVEERLFTDAAFLEEVEAAENDWLDAWAAGTLALRQRARFERGYLVSEERRRRAAFARALRRAGRPAVAPRVRASSWAALAAAALALAVVIPRREPPARAVVAEGPRAASPAPSSVTPVPSPVAPPAAQRARPVILLLAAAVRGEPSAPTPVVRLAAVGDEVVLQAPLDFEAGPGARFDVALETVEGGVVWSRAGARAQAARGGTHVGVRVPRSALRPGDLLVRLRLRTPGAPDEDAGSFLLRVLAD